MRKTASPAEPAVSPARRRLLGTATRLFYAVGIDRIIAEAGVAKATFYNHVPSKEDLVPPMSRSRTSPGATPSRHALWLLVALSDGPLEIAYLDNSREVPGLVEAALARLLVRR